MRNSVAILLLALAATAGPSMERVQAQSTSGGATARQLYQQGQAAETSEDYYGAIESYLGALRENPSYAEPMIGLAQSYYSLDEYDIALKYAQQASRYVGTDSRVLNLQGRILVGLGQIDKARAVYQRVLASEPNNVEARIGLAELAVAQGNTDGALAQYQEAIRLEPQNRKALLSLALLYRSRGENDVAGRYIRLALQYHAGSAEVHLLAGEYYSAQGDTDQALRHAQTALALRPDYPQAILLLGEVYLGSSDYAKASAAMDQLIAQERGSGGGSATQSRAAVQQLAWYIKGVAQAKLDRPADSIRSFQRLLALDPGDEVARLAMEQVVKDSLPMEATARSSYAKYHFDLAANFEKENLFQHALFQYRQGLQIAPLSREGRLGFAELYRLEGFRAKYVSELKVLKNLGYTDKTVTDRLEIFSSMLHDTVSADWNIDQFSLERNNTSIMVFVDPGKSVFTHPDAGGYFGSYLRDLLLGYELTASPAPAQLISRFSDAFAAARRTGSDYFIVLSVDEGDRTLSLSATLYLSRTGAPTASFTVYRSGNGRVEKATARLADLVDSTLPLSGKLVARNFDRGVIDLGAMHDIKKDDAFNIIQAGQLSRNSDGTAFVYPPEALIGTFTVERVDDAVAEGTIKRTGISDLINTGDLVVPVPKEKPKQQTETASYPPLYNRLRTLR
ncbi:tetratricopeptide repeat protein [Salinispira pacifica]